MLLDDFEKHFCNLSSEDQAIFLANMSHNMTVSARDLYPQANNDYDVNDIMNKQQSINEVQHQISDHIIALLTDRKDRYPDDILCRIITGKSNIYGNSIKQVEWAIKRTMAYPGKKEH